MFRPTFVSIFLALALVASHSKAGPTSHLDRRQQYTVRSVTQTWVDLDVQIQNSEKVIRQNYVTGQMATDQFQRVSDGFYTAMYRLQACGSPCIEQDMSNFLGTFSNCFRVFTGLFQSAQTIFPRDWNNMFSKSFLRLSDDFALFFATCFGHSTALKGLVTQPLFQFFLYTGMEQTVKTLRAWGLP